MGEEIVGPLSARTLKCSDSGEMMDDGLDLRAGSSLVFQGMFQITTLRQWMRSCGSVVEYDLTQLAVSLMGGATLICVEALRVDVKDVDVASASKQEGDLGGSRRGLKEWS